MAKGEAAEAGSRGARGPCSFRGARSRTLLLLEPRAWRDQRRLGRWTRGLDRGTRVPLLQSGSTRRLGQPGASGRGDLIATPGALPLCVWVVLPLGQPRTPRAPGPQAALTARATMGLRGHEGRTWDISKKMKSLAGC